MKLGCFRGAALALFLLVLSGISLAASAAMAGSLTESLLQKGSLLQQQNSGPLLTIIFCSDTQGVYKPCPS